MIKEGRHYFIKDTTSGFYLVGIVNNEPVWVLSQQEPLLFDTLAQVNNMVIYVKSLNQYGPIISSTIKAFVIVVSINEVSYD